LLCREKNSANAERLVQFTGSSQICGLPPYLTVQMMRFFFKRTPDGGQKAKILRKVCWELGV
jgi:ubiquitin carboxyl-terminal hydrolase 14